MSVQLLVDVSVRASLSVFTQDLEDYDRGLARSLRQIASAPEDTITDFGLDFSDAGGSADVDVTASNRDEYISKRVQFVLVESRKVRQTCGRVSWGVSFLVLTPSCFRPLAFAATFDGVEEGFHVDGGWSCRAERRSRSSLVVVVNHGCRADGACGVACLLWPGVRNAASVLCVRADDAASGPTDGVCGRAGEGVGVSEFHQQNTGEYVPCRLWELTEGKGAGLVTGWWSVVTASSHHSS